MPQAQATIMPMVSVPSVDAVRDFYVEKLGFEHQMGVVGKDGTLDFVNVTRDGCALMFSRNPEGAAAGPPRQSVEFYINVKDVKAMHDEVTAKGVAATDPLTDQWWGDRTFVVKDPNGYRVWFATGVAKPQPPPGTKVI